MIIVDRALAAREARAGRSGSAWSAPGSWAGAGEPDRQQRRPAWGWSPIANRDLERAEAGYR